MNLSGDLPPVWVEIHHQTENLLTELSDISNSLREKEGGRGYIWLNNDWISP